jgi:hypothetical protein
MRPRKPYAPAVGVSPDGRFRPVVLFCPYTFGGESPREGFYFPMLSHSESHSDCIAACHECIAACEAWLTSVRALDRAGALENCAELCQSSIRLCNLVIEELSLRSAFSPQVCALGTVICRACAEEFAAAKEVVGETCVAACLRAAAECHAVATMSPAHATA